METVIAVEDDMEKAYIPSEEIKSMVVRLQRSGAASGSTELLAAAEMLSSLLRERELAVHCIDEVFKAVADLPQHPADAYFSILRFRKETGRHKTLI